ncbi:MAG: FKBP-type peptidyl-prolyl cis-trans isomerase [Shewanella sp.]|nr:FKBP-type peptidyl-prolyl cis-trans isomerase [Shewanella sp.]MCF1430038.1 FKBP-type peptidyl-prolyl cis-trans isomerase [Shewanella sp.]MCF1438657.1 FKBP-type peptidyl-prolyl cis-trans isomerase [Shewanella sp.]MCF1458869.1 FKBP-type peptidyl-prolyl cis-trans isomerase [Shewanella sp.]
MKVIYKFSLVALTVASLAGCNQEQAKVTPAQALTPDAMPLTTPEQKESYSVGASIGAYLRERITEQESLGMPVDRKLIVEGFSNGLNNKLQLTEEEVQTVLQNLDKKLNDKRTAQSEALASKMREESKKFLEENAKKEGVKTTDSGLQYEVLKEGTGGKPQATDTVEVNYRGTLIDGTEFDSSYKRGEPIKFQLDRVIPGWTEGVQLMPVGSKYKFFIPSDLAYGDRDTGTIPANSTLIFEVELLGIDKPAAEPKK